MKVSEKNSNKQKNLCGVFAGDEVEDISRVIQKMFENFHFIEILEAMRRDKFRVNNWFAYHFITNTLLLKELGNQKSNLYSSKITQKANEHFKEDTSPFDIIESDGEVAITIEMPDVKREDIYIGVAKDIMEIMPGHPGGKYHKIINFPCDVEPRTLTFTYINGILDIVLQREVKKRSDQY